MTLRVRDVRRATLAHRTARRAARVCAADDWDDWRDGPHAQPRLARAVGAARRAGQPRSRHRPRGVPGPLRRVGASASLRHRVRVRHRSCAGRRLIGEVSLGSVQRGPFQSAFVGYWIDAVARGQRLRARGGRARSLRYAFEELDLHRIEAAIVPAQRPQPARRRRSSGCATRARRSGSSRSGACGRTTCATRSPARSGTCGATTTSGRSSGRRRLRAAERAR